MTLLLIGRWVLRDARLGRAGLLENGGVLVEGRLIAAVDRADVLRAAFPHAEIIAQPDGLVLPGLINAHHHGRGVGPLTEGGQDGPLELWMFQPAFWRALPSSSSRLYTIARQLRSGVTSSLEAHMAYGPLESYRSAVEDALATYRHSGVRVALALGLQDKNPVVYDEGAGFLQQLPPATQKFVEQWIPDVPNLHVEEYFALFAELCETWRDARTQLFLGSTAPQWLSDALLVRCAQTAEDANTGLHLHVNETREERAYGPRVYGEPVVRHLAGLDILSPRCSAAHAVWLDDEDIDLLAEHGVSVVHNPSSNLRLHSGVAPVSRLLERGVNVALGMDSNSFADDDDMYAEMRLASLLHRGQGIDSSGPSAYQILAMATVGGAQALQLADVGTLAPGKRADLQVVAMTRVLGPAPGPLVDPVELLVARAKADDMQTVLVDGDLLVRDGVLVHLHLPSIERRVAEEADALREHFPHVELAEAQQSLHALIRLFYANWRTEQA